MEFSRQECWSGLPFPSPGDLPDLGIKPESPALQVDSLPSEPLGMSSQLNLGHSMNASGEGDGTALQYSCLENPMDGDAW